MAYVGESRVSARGQMSLPATARHRWHLDNGGLVSHIDLGDVMIILPGGVDALRSEMLAGISEEVWEEATRGFGDPDLATL
jgi:hypothetical protein